MLIDFENIEEKCNKGLSKEIPRKEEKRGYEFMELWYNLKI